MTIEGISALNGVQQAEEAKVRAEAKARQEKDKVRQESGDSVEIAGNEVARLSSTLNDIPDVRSDKIEALQKEISEGTYKVPSEKLANIILDELI